MKVDNTIPEENGPVRVVNANPDVKYFEKAPFKTGKIFQDTDNGITVKVLGKQENNYWIGIMRR